MKISRIVTLILISLCLYLVCSCAKKPEPVKYAPSEDGIESQIDPQHAQEIVVDSLDTDLEIIEEERGGSTTTENN